MTNLKAVAEAYGTFQRAMDGDFRAKADVAESLTTSDFPGLLGQAFSAKLQATYQGIAPVWQQYATRVVVPNFKAQRLVSLLGGQRGLTLVPEATEYPASDLADAKFEFQVRKYGDRLPLTWEMLVNDELGIFRGVDQRLAVEARDTEGVATATALLKADRSDVNTDFFKAANGNAPQNVPLTMENLRQAIQDLSVKKGANGETLVRPNLVLVVPPTLEYQARALLAATEVRTVIDNVTTVSANPVANALPLVVDPNLLLNSNTKAATTWYVLPAPNSIRPAVITAFLAGHETPDLRVKADTGNRIGGGSIAPEDGSFDDDTIQYRVRHIVGASVADPTFAFVSRGA